MDIQWKRGLLDVCVLDPGSDFRRNRDLCQAGEKNIESLGNRTSGIRISIKIQ